MAERAFSPKQREALKIVAEGRMVPTLVREEDGWFARWRALGSDNGWVDEFVRSAAMTPLTEDAENERHETLHDAWMAALRSRTGLVAWDDAECAAFAAELEEWAGCAEEDVAARGSLAFRLRCPRAADDPSDFALECSLPRGRRALRALGQSMYVFPPLRGLRSAGARLEVALSRAEAESFVRSGAGELLAAGYGVEGGGFAAPVTAIVETADGDRPGERILGTDLVVKVAGERVTAEEVRFLLDQGSTLVFFRDRWIEVDRNILREALRALERASGRRLSLAEAVGFASGVGRIGNLEVEELRARGWVRGLVNSLAAKGAGALGPWRDPDGFAGRLRDYQRRGVEWLAFLTGWGFGALLADDMGLGKTVEVIAWMLGEIARAKAAGESRKGPMLVVAPLTLLGNWQHEFARFAPDLAIHVHQGETRHVGSGFARVARSVEVVVTSYSLLVRDYSALSEVAWHALVLDEAQAIKNPDTQVARAVRALTPPKRIALTGTPVENSVADIWSLEEFLNPGFLGDRRSFVERFVRPIALDEQSVAGKRLKRALEPFVLRRLKSDPQVAGELGEKREIKEYCALSPAQRSAYERALEGFRAAEHRQGDVFALLTELKLICDGEGKLARLEELLEGVFANGESALVFTQYAKVGAELQRVLAARFGRRFPFLHGSLGLREREAEIAKFRRGGPVAFILSLKAGGYGLNLTKATHVIHFDRWWNPAVENQATDRAHRIGQTKTVFVHEFITSGTLEEHVDELLETKSRLAGSLVASGESFLASLQREDLIKVAALD